MAPAQRSPGAPAKAAAKVTTEGRPVHSLATVLNEFASVVATRIQLVGGLTACTSNNTLTLVQRRAFDLLGISHRLMHTSSGAPSRPHFRGQRPHIASRGELRSSQRSGGERWPD